MSEHDSEKVQAIATRHPVTPMLVKYWLEELQLSPEVADILASLTGEGCSMGAVNAAAMALGQYPDDRLPAYMEASALAMSSGAKVIDEQRRRIGRLRMWISRMESAIEAEGGDAHRHTNARDHYLEPGDLDPSPPEVQP